MERGPRRQRADSEQARQVGGVGLAAYRHGLVAPGAAVMRWAARMGRWLCGDWRED